MYEARRHPPLERQRFARRMLRHGAAALGLVFAPALPRLLHHFHWDAQD